MHSQKRAKACKSIILSSAQGLTQLGLLASHAAHAWGRQLLRAVISVIIDMGQAEQLERSTG